jgi:hypothetical protein
MPTIGIALTHDQLRSIASLTAFASREDVTPVITGVRLSVEEGRIIAQATDRYRVAELSLPLPIKPTDREDAFTAEEEVNGGAAFEAITIPAAFLARVIKSLPRKPLLRGATIALIVTAEGMGVTVRDRIHGFESSERTIIGNYPPVGRLFPKSLDEVKAFYLPVGLNAAFLASLDKLSLPTDIGSRGAKLYTMRTWESEITGSTKPRPVLFTREDGDVTLRAMIQPNLINR